MRAISLKLLRMFCVYVWYVHVMQVISLYTNHNVAGMADTAIVQKHSCSLGMQFVTFTKANYTFRRSCYCSAGLGQCLTKICYSHCLMKIYMYSQSILHSWSYNYRLAHDHVVQVVDSSCGWGAVWMLHYSPTTWQWEIWTSCSPHILTGHTSTGQQPLRTSPRRFSVS